MRRDFVASSNLASVGYDEKSQTLEVEFQDGSVYQYYNVPKTIYDQLMAESSKGKYLAANIKGQFPYSRV